MAYVCNTSREFLLNQSFGVDKSKRSQNDDWTDKAMFDQRKSEREKNHLIAKSVIFLFARYLNYY